MIHVVKNEVKIKGDSIEVEAELALAIDTLAREVGKTPTEFVEAMIPAMEMTRAVIDVIRAKRENEKGS